MYLQTYILYILYTSYIIPIGCKYQISVQISNTIIYHLKMTLYRYLNLVIQLMSYYVK